MGDALHRCPTTCFTRRNVCGRNGDALVEADPDVIRCPRQIRPLLSHATFLDVPPSCCLASGQRRLDGRVDRIGADVQCDQIDGARHTFATDWHWREGIKYGLTIASYRTTMTSCRHNAYGSTYTNVSRPR
jgi:hypothetical protein